MWDWCCRKRGMQASMHLQEDLERAASRIFERAASKTSERAASQIFERAVSKTFEQARHANLQK